MTKRTGSFVGIMTIATALAASTAQAQVTTSYAGTECVHEITTTPKIVYQSSRAFNNSTFSATFACPAAQHGGKLLRATVFGRDVSIDGAVTCFIKVMDPFDVSGFTSGSVSTPPGFTGSFTLKLTPLPTTFFDPGSKVVHCTLPPNAGIDGSSIGSYRITEE
jgi:hypothetical protein